MCPGRGRTRGLEVGRPGPSTSSSCCTSTRAQSIRPSTCGQGHSHPDKQRSSYRAKQTAGQLRVSDVICIMMHTSPLKTNAHGIRVELSNLGLFHVYEVAMQKSVRSLGATIMT